MARIKNHSVPMGELAAGLAGKTLSTALKSSSGGANYIVPRTMVLPLTGGLSSNSVQVIAVENPETFPLMIRQATLVVRTPGASSASIDIGIVNSSSKTAKDVVSSADISSEAVSAIIVGHLLAENGCSEALTRSNISIWEKNGNSSDNWLTARLVQDSASSLAGYLMIEVVPFHST